MIVSRTPLRMSFVGGGTDLPSFYRKNGGSVLSTAIDKYIYVNVNRKFDDGIRIAYSKTEEIDSVIKIDHKLVRATLEMMNISGGIEITTIADIPSRGTGLGSSSAFTVGLINALGAYLDCRFGSHELGQASCEVEIERCGEPIGKQDQYASAFGGLNLIEFKPDESVVVTPVAMPGVARAELERRLLFFYTGSTRSASNVLKAQSESVDADVSKQAALRRMAELAHALYRDLRAGNLDSVGNILHENWQLKKSLSEHVSNSAIDQAYAAALQAGALGGKLLGAGAGGFLMFYAREEFHDSVRNSLSQLREVRIHFEPGGSVIVLDDRKRRTGPAFLKGLDTSSTFPVEQPIG